jgi:hypothetical protein
VRRSKLLRFPFLIPITAFNTISNVWLRAVSGTDKGWLGLGGGESRLFDSTI